MPCEHILSSDKESKRVAPRMCRCLSLWLSVGFCYVALGVFGLIVRYWAGVGIMASSGQL